MASVIPRAVSSAASSGHDQRVAVDSRLQPLDAVRVPVSNTGYRQLCKFARRRPEATWAIEGAAGLGAPLTARLATDGITVLDVPAKPARRVRLLSAGHGRKSDEADALSVGIAAHTAVFVSDPCSAQGLSGLVPSDVRR
jgi:hypothetical protein